MSGEPSLLQWITSLGLMAFFTWVLLGMFWDLVPTPWNHADAMHKKFIAVGLTLMVGLLNLSLARPVLQWFWLGLKHVLGMDLKGL